MSVRKIPKNHIHVTGRHAAQKSEGSADFESVLESEHLLLLDHDTLVKAYEVQPVNIPVPGVPRGYVPDVFVEFYPDLRIPVNVTADSGDRDRWRCCAFYF